MELAKHIPVVKSGFLKKRWKECMRKEPNGGERETTRVIC